MLETNRIQGMPTSVSGKCTSRDCQIAEGRRTFLTPHLQSAERGPSHSGGSGSRRSMAEVHPPSPPSLFPREIGGAAVGYGERRLGSGTRLRSGGTAHLESFLSASSRLTASSCSAVKVIISPASTLGLARLLFWLPLAPEPCLERHASIQALASEALPEVPEIPAADVVATGAACLLRHASIQARASAALLVVSTLAARTGRSRRAALTDSGTAESDFKATPDFVREYMVREPTGNSGNL
mmetsp:Transcript_36791/g.87408  ORF Transcript_36791/g.87408 Transcript_36791/m.87408 type:complete len:241 (-) Transcript_36791:153-875(-)